MDLEGNFTNPRIHRILQNLVSSQPLVVHTPRFKVQIEQEIKLLTDAELKSVHILWDT